MPHGESDLELAFQEAIAENGVTLPPAFVGALSKGLVKAVEFATDHATQNIVGYYRRKLVLQIALMTAVIVAAISIPTTYIITNESAARSRRDAHVNCQNITALAALQASAAKKQDASTERFEKQSKDRFGLTDKEFKRLVAEGAKERKEQLHAIQRIAATTCDPP